jgi:polyhydroxybutyrate depolymerase
VIAIALPCSACSSDLTGSKPSPRSNPGADPLAPGAGEASGPAVSATNPGDTSSPAPASTSTSENPVSPDLTLNPDGTGASGASAADGGSSEPAATDPEGAPPGDPSAPPQPSVMCGSGGASLSFDLPNTLFSVPDSYDGSTPLPVVIAFHAAGNENTQLRGILGNTLQDEYIMLYPKSDGNGWSNGADAPKVDAIFNALDATACYDKRRVFATGHSSGAQFIVQRLCAGETRWRAVAPVASSVYCSSWEPIPALVIHGIGDVERRAYGLDDGDGLKDIVPYRTSNGCQETYTEVPVDGCNSGGVQVDPGCRDFDGCSERTRWCQHTDPQYGTSHHGVPCFGARVIQQFFDAYR